MAFDAAVGNNQFSQGNWSPIIYSKLEQDYFERASVVKAITNTKYSGEITAGGTVNIIKVPVLTTTAYTRGAEIQYQDLDDSQVQMVIDQAFYSAFRIDDIEKSLGHIDWMGIMAKKMAYELANKFDSNVLTAMQSNATVGSGCGTDASPITIGFGSGNSFTPLDYINQFAKLLDENDIPPEGRFFAATPAFFQSLAREDSSLIDAMIIGDPESVIRNRNLATNKMIHGFTMYKTNNMPLSSGNSRITVLAGHVDATSTAEKLLKIERTPLERSFGEGCKGLKVWGRKVTRAEALFTGHISNFTDA